MNSSIVAVAFALCSLSVAAAPASATGAAAAKRIVIVFPPLSSDDATQRLGLVMQEETMALLRGHTGNPELHAKQLNAMGNNEGVSFDPADAATLERAVNNLGGTVGVATRLERGPKGITVKGTIVTLGGKPKSVTATLPLTSSKAVEEGVKQLYGWAAGSKIPAKNDDQFPPVSANDAAVDAYARCYATLVKQPMGIDNPTIFDPEVIKGAVTSCRESVAADAKWPTPKAALALALAIDGSDAEATQLVGTLKDDGDILPLYWIARFWLVTRYQSPEAGKAVLIEATGFRPGFGLAEMYLCELLLTLNQNESGLKLCEAALASMPRAVFPELRVAKALARLGRHDEAIVRTQAAGTRDPKSREAKLQLASRYIDANKLPEAIKVLEPLVAETNVRGETLLRLGYAYEETSQLDKALPMYQRAIGAATSPGEWRTRGPRLVRRGGDSRQEQRQRPRDRGAARGAQHWFSRARVPPVADRDCQEPRQERSQARW